MQQAPMMMIRMRCPACLCDGRFLVEATTPLEVLPEIAKQVMRCWCDNHVPKIFRNTPIETTLMSINAVPFSELKNQLIGMKQMKSFKPIDADLN